MYRPFKACPCNCHGITWNGLYPPSCHCNCHLGKIDTAAVTTQKLAQIAEQKKVDPTNSQVFQESVLTHIHGINRIINLYDKNQSMQHAKTLLDVAYDLIIKGLSANE